jgi:hypothetical protein
VLDQPVLLAQSDAVEEEPLEDVAIGEALRLRLRDRLVGGQLLGERVAEEQAQIEPQRRDPQQLAHRADPLQRPGQHQLQQHRRIDRRPPDTLGVIRPRSQPAARCTRDLASSISSAIRGSGRRAVDQDLEPIPAPWQRIAGGKACRRRVEGAKPADPRKPPAVMRNDAPLDGLAHGIVQF